MIRIGVIQQLTKVYRGAPVLNPYHEKYDLSRVETDIKEINLEAAATLVEQAARLGCDIVFTPADVHGVFPWIASMDKPENRHYLAEHVPGPSSLVLSDLARQHSINIVTSLFEVDGPDIYYSAIVIDRDGDISGRYRKVHLFGMERWLCHAGNDFPVVTTDVGRIGIMLGKEILIPEVAASLALNGAEIIACLTTAFPAPETVLDAMVRTRAVDHSLPFVLANRAHRHRPGRSCLVNHEGQIIADGAYEVDEVVTANLAIGAERYDPDSLSHGEPDLRVRMLAARRPDLYVALTQAKPRAFDYLERLWDALGYDEELARFKRRQWGV